MAIPLVILHGWGASARSFDKIKGLLEQKGISVFVFDLPGFGSELAPKEAWSVDDYVEWARKRIENEGKIILFGHSFGGRIAIKFAAKYPEKLAGLILCDAAGVTPRPKIKIAVFNFLSKIGNAIFSLPFLKFLQPLARKFVYWLSGERDYYYLKKSVMQKTFRLVIEENLRPHLTEIHVPTLIVWGEKDRMTPLNDAYTIHNGIAGSKMEILKNIGHNPHLECPEKLAEIIGSFLIK